MSATVDFHLMKFPTVYTVPAMGGVLFIPVTYPFEKIL